jgi:arylsulfatase
MSHLAWAPTLLAAVGVSNVKQQLLKGYRAGTKTFKAHLDGYNFLPHLTGQAKQGPRREFLYFSDDGLLVGARIGDWKTVFAEQRSRRFDVWREPFVFLRIPKLFHLRRDPYEKADTDSNAYNEWWADRTPRIAQAAEVIAQFLGSLRQFPPSQRPASFTIDQVFEGVMRQLERDR